MWNVVLTPSGVNLAGVVAGEARMRVEPNHGFLDIGAPRYPRAEIIRGEGGQDLLGSRGKAYLQPLAGFALVRKAGNKDGLLILSVGMDRDGDY